MAGLRLVDLFKTYDRVAAVQGVSLDITSGEFIVVLGPSGCGKTTTLRCIAGLEKPDRGSIIIDGVDVMGLPPKDRDVAMVFQNYALYPHMTGYENIGYPLRMSCCTAYLFGPVQPICYHSDDVVERAGRLMSHNTSCHPSIIRW